MKVWITKYATTQGIYEAEVHSTSQSGMVAHRNGYNNTQYFHYGEWHLHRGDALDKAEDMRLKKIKSLQKQIAKLEAMKFE